MKTFLLTLTEEQCEAVGYAIMAAIREQKARLAKDANDYHAQDLLTRLQAAYDKLDTCPERKEAV